MDHTRYTAAREGERRRPTRGAAPVLARLPLVSPGRLIAEQSPPAAPKIGYRIDPPQTERVAPPPADEKRTASARSLKSELISAPRSSPKSHPHIFDWARTKEQRARNPQVETRHLPRSNTFLHRHRWTLEMLGPILRFATIVVLFTAAGTWFQLSVFRPGSGEPEAEPPKTAIRDAAPASGSTKRPLPMPTAVGPVSVPSETSSGKRVGRTSNGDYATLRGDILPDPASATGGGASTASVDKHPRTLPRTQTTEPAEAAPGAIASQPVVEGRGAVPVTSAPAMAASAAARPAATSEVARLPGLVEGQHGTRSR